MSNPLEPEVHPHKPADDREEIYYAGSPLLRAEMGSIFIWGLAGLVLISLPFVWKAITKLHEMPSALVTLGLIIVGLLVIAWPILRQRTVRYRISNYRIDYERGLLSKSIDTMELWHVEDLEFHQSIFDRIVQTGTITIISKDETNPKLVLRGVPNPRPLFETLKQRVIAVKRQSGVIKMT